MSLKQFIIERIITAWYLLKQIWTTNVRFLPTCAYRLGPNQAAFKVSKLPASLTIDYVKTSAFFAGEKQDVLELVIADAPKKQSQESGSKEEEKEPVAEVQPVTVAVA